MIELNPMTLVVESSKLALLGQGHVTASTLVCSILITAVVSVSGLLVFQRTARTFIDTV
ncbi:MAG: hypothetical protein HC904_13450 [Blastochloris sp.]|nr:hypothetical protein [Blastochloris sp.]